LTRAEPLGIKVEIMKLDEMHFEKKDISGFLFQYPDTEGSITNLEHVIKKAKESGVYFSFNNQFHFI
jgi:glycine dehydrogenase